MLMRGTPYRGHMGRIAVTDGMDDEAIESIEAAGHVVVCRHYSNEELIGGALRDFDAVVIRSATKMTASVIRASHGTDRRLRFIGRAGVGVDNIDVGVASDMGIIVCNTPSASTRSVVELTIGHLIASTRMIARADCTLREGEWAKKELRGSEIGGKRLGLIGLGRIARGVAEIATSFGMEIHAFDPFVTKVPNGIIMHDDLDDVFRNCTHISIHCNLTEDTRNLVNSYRISLMPDVGLDGTECGNHIVSCARGGIVDEHAALEALQSGHLKSLALDVFEVEPLGDSSLLSIEGFHGSPHIAASTLEAQSRIGSEMASLIIEFFACGKPSTSLNADRI
jgi:D-3-phosphoglycerate dehydrogenase|tara:strand:- start:100810 stop:101823 length:1014 start_codon:yes stop_codon:yes gene_type:complete